MQQQTLPTLTPRGSSATVGTWTLTVTDVQLGDDAATTIANSNAGNPTAPNGLSYVLAKVRADNIGTTDQPITPADFSATGADGVLRHAISLAIPDPALQGVVVAGQSLEGWIPLGVDDITAPTLWFESTILGNTTQRAVLALTDGAAIPTFTTEAASSDLGTDPANPAAINDTVVTGDWAVTILRTAAGQEIFDLADYRLQALGDSDTTGTEISTWLGVSARITNQSAHPAVFSPNAITLVDSTGEAWDNILQLTPPDPDLARELLPGATREGWVVFQALSYVTDRIVRIQPFAIADEPRYVALDDSAVSSSSETTTSSDTGEPLDLTTGDHVVVNDDQVNLRAEASTTGDIVAELAKGTELTVTGEPIEADGYRWYPVTVDETGDDGYIVQDFIDPVES